YYDDSLLLYSLPINQRLAKYMPTPYQKIDFLTYLGNQRVLIWRYTFSNPTYQGRVYYYENYTNLIWSSSEITSYYYPILCYTYDVNGDTKVDIIVEYTNPDTSQVLLIYRGNLLAITQFNKNGDKSMPTNKLSLSLPSAGNYEIDFYDALGRKRGTYFLKGKEGENIITPPFLISGLCFYTVRKEKEIILKGKTLYLGK
ncbi:MAG: hypothetical protein N2323_04260, partial [candidate division WOR-3 bacterium]|nr:hypothetical protein [candidate division WOR-3 bacterium]